MISGDVGGLLLIRPMTVKNDTLFPEPDSRRLERVAPLSVTDGRRPLHDAVGSIELQLRSLTSRSTSAKRPPAASASCFLRYLTRGSSTRTRCHDQTHERDEERRQHSDGQDRRKVSLATACTT